MMLKFTYGLGIVSIFMRVTFGIFNALMILILSYLYFFFTFAGIHGFFFAAFLSVPILSYNDSSSGPASYMLTEIFPVILVLFSASGFVNDSI